MQFGISDTVWSLLEAIMMVSCEQLKKGTKLLLSLSESMIKLLIYFHFFSTDMFSWSWYNLVLILTLNAKVKTTTTGENKKIKYVL